MLLIFVIDETISTATWARKVEQTQTRGAHKHSVQTDGAAMLADVATDNTPMLTGQHDVLLQELNTRERTRHRASTA